MPDDPQANAYHDLLKHHYPEQTIPYLQRQIGKVLLLLEIADRHRLGQSVAGDWFKAARLLLSLSKREVVSLALDLTNKDEFLYPAALQLRKRLKNNVNRHRIKFYDRDLKILLRNNEIEQTVFAVAQLQNDLGITVDEAFENLAAGKPYSAEKVRADYKKAIGRARDRGYAVSPSINAFVRERRLSVAPTSPKGRRKKEERNT